MKVIQNPIGINDRSGGLLVYVNENIPSHIKNDFQFSEDIQIVPIEINLRKQKWLIISIYRPPKQNIKYFLENLASIYDFYTRTNDNILVMGDFNAAPHDPIMKNFVEKYGLYNHIKTKTCWKLSNGTYIDLLLSNKKSFFFYEVWSCGNGIK